MHDCWNTLCIAGDCDGINHVDATGVSWSQDRDEEYCRIHAAYDTCAGQR